MLFSPYLYDILILLPMSKVNIRQQVQKFGRKLSGMIMPNIGAFIAWGLLTALFIPTGWWPNEKLAVLVDPMLKYLLPLLIAYTAGRNVGGDRGGVTGAVAAMGVIIGSDIPMFIGAMIMGPIGGWCIKKFDKLVDGKAKAGFEMLINNFSIGIIGLLLAIAGYMIIGDMIAGLTSALGNATQYLVNNHLIPLTALIVEPAKVLFLNNAINHGIFSPIGIEQANEIGRSIMFLIETNPGPGAGVLLACWMFAKGATKESAPGALVIQFFGGIHEIYFPYVLARPSLLIAAIAGSASALLYYSVTGSGLVAPASPGCIFTYIAMAPKGETLTILTGIAISAGVSFLTAMPFVRKEKKEEALATDGSHENLLAKTGKIGCVVFACDAGMGSSALGATRFRKRVSEAGLDVKVTNSAIDKVPATADVVVCQKGLADRARISAPGRDLVIIDNFLSDPSLDRLIEKLIRQNDYPADHDGESSLLKMSNIVTGLGTESKEEAIKRAGMMLYASGYVDETYIPAMLEREKITTTYMGMGLAIPHGTSDAKAAVRKSGITVLQYPDGVDFAGEKARLIIGIAGVGNEHLDILAKLSETLDDMEVLERLMTTSDPSEIYKVLK